MPIRSVTLAAPAKVNLYLGVHTELDERDYHRVDSVMSAVSVTDTVTVGLAPTLSVECSPSADCPVTDNTAWKAACAMAGAFSREPDLAIHIEKGIPARSGLGGASTDAAAVIRAICRLWDIDADAPDVSAVLARVARSVGADVPFFLYGPPAFLSGAGDVLAERFRPLEGVRLALVKPLRGGITAREAYEQFDLDPTPIPPVVPMLDALRANDADRVVASLANNLDPVARGIEPWLDDLRAWMTSCAGVRRVLVTGSGSCTYAVCSDATSAGALVEEASANGCWATVATLVGHGPVFVEG
jgi:4-diphosphocytidyl-2-C-methyl-D-erythritol kinase